MAAERLAYLEAVVGADITQFRKSMRDIRNDVGILSETISGIGGAARTMTFAFTAPMVALGSFAVQAAGSFDASMRNINSILGLSEENFQGLSKEAFDFARTTRAGVTPAVDALYEVFSAGITDQERAMEIWKISNQVSEAGLADLSQTTNIMTATMSAFNLETDQATRVGNVWTRTVQQGVGSLSDFLSNAQKVLPLSNELSVSLEDMGASIAFLSQGGGGASKAETSYAMMLSNLLKPTEAATEAFKKLNVASGRELIEKFGSVGAAVKALRDTVPENIFNKMFSKTGLEAALRMTNNFDALQESIKGFNTNLEDATMDAWTQQSMSFNFQLGLLKTALEGAAVTIGQKIIPLITPLVAGFTQFFSSVSEANPQLLELGVIFIGIVAAAAPIIWLLTSLLNPIGLITAAVVTLGGAFATNFAGIQTTVINAVDSIVGGLQPLKDAWDTFMDSMFGGGVGSSATDKQESPLAALVDSTHQVGTDAGEGMTLAFDSAISAWDLYNDSGLADKISWKSFQDELKKQGWTGGALFPEDSYTLFGESLKTKSNAELERSRGRSMESGAAAPTEGNTIFDRLIASVAAAWPKLQIALDTMWTNFKSWVTDTALPALDEFAGTGIEAIAKIFLPLGSTGEGDSPLYTALQDLFKADIGGAAANIGTWFNEQFPTISAAITTFVENIGAWLVQEGIPTIARSIGYFVGKMAVLLSQAISGIWDFLNKDIPLDDVSSAATGIGDALITPLGEGFNDAIKDSGITNPIDALFTSLSSALIVGATAWIIAPGLVKIIASKVWGVITSAFAANMGASAVATAVETSAGTAVGQGLSNLSSNIPAWVSGAGGTAAAGGGAGILTLALPALAIAATVTAIALVVDENARTQAHNVITSLIDGLFGEGTSKEIEDNFSTGFSAAIANLAASLGRADIAAAAMGQGSDVAKQSAQDILDVFYYHNNPRKLSQEEILRLHGYTDEMLMLAGFHVGNVIAAAATVPVNNQPQPTTGSNPFLFAGSPMPNTTELEATLETTLGTAAQNALNAGIFNGQQLVDTFITPLAEGFITNFAPESPSVINWNAFVTSVDTGAATMFNAFSTISTGLILLETDATTHMPIITGIFLTAMQKIKISIMDVGYQLTLLSQRLAGLDGQTIQVTTQVVSPEVDGSHAGGLGYVPYDGYIAELHKGERVLTATENRSGQVTGRGAVASNSTSNTATFNVYADSFDDILREAKRRGYDIGKR